MNKAEETANQLGFKVEDKFWDTKTKEYKGECKGFTILNNYLHLKFKDCSISNTWNYLPLTNKVAIHCPTKEDFEFIYKRIYNKDYHNSLVNMYNPNTCISINQYEFGYKTILLEQGYLVLNINEYMQSIEEKPLFVTEDNVNVYNPDKLIYWIDNYNKIQQYVAGYWDMGFKVFSTKQAAQRYLDNQILFYTEDFKDGSFPKDGCKGCTRDKEECKYIPCKGQINKGEPIRKGDKCWRINEIVSICSLEACYHNWENTNTIVDPTIKYFSNRKNAENYQNSLKQKDMQKVEITIPENYQVTDTFENRITDNLTLKGVILEKKQAVITTKDNVNLYLGDTFYFIDETNTINESKIVNPNFEILSEYLHFSTKEAAQNYLKSLLKANTGKFGIGDKVKVVRKAESCEGDWKASWNNLMDYCINKEGVIHKILSENNYGYNLAINNDYWSFPEFVLELVEKPLVKVDDKFIYASDLKENEVYWSNRGHNSLGVIWRFKSVKEDEDSMYINTYSEILLRNTDFVLNSGINSVWFENLREATPEEIQHLERCEYFGIYMDPLLLEENKWYESTMEDEETLYALYSSKGGKYCGFSFNHNWSEYVADKDDLLKGFIPANMDKIKSLLLEKAKKDYPVGSRFKSEKGGFECIVTDDTVLSIYANKFIYLTNGHTGIDSRSYQDGKWAEIIKEEFKVGDWIIVKSYKQCREGNGIYTDNLLTKLLDINTKGLITSGIFKEESDYVVQEKDSYQNIKQSHVIRKATKEEVKKHLQEKADKEIEETLKNFNE